MNFSFDLDGTITCHPEVFQALGRALIAAGHSVVILTGIPRSYFDGIRKDKYPFLRDTSWYQEVITSDMYNDNEKSLANKVIEGKMDNRDLVGIYKRRVCKERDIAVHFDDDYEHVFAKDGVPVFGICR